MIKKTKTALFQILSVSFGIYTEIERYLYKTKAFEELNFKLNQIIVTLLLH